jgi:hypothetical protein
MRRCGECCRSLLKFIISKLFEFIMISTQADLEFPSPSRAVRRRLVQLREVVATEAAARRPLDIAPAPLLLDEEFALSLSGLLHLPLGLRGSPGGADEGPTLRGPLVWLAWRLHPVEEACSERGCACSKGPQAPYGARCCSRHRPRSLSRYRAPQLAQACVSPWQTLQSLGKFEGSHEQPPGMEDVISAASSVQQEDDAKGGGITTTRDHYILTITIKCVQDACHADYRCRSLSLCEWRLE